MMHMNVTTALSQLTSLNSKFDSIFHQLESFFPQLIHGNDRTSFSQLKAAITSISNGILTDKASSTVSFGEKYAPIFDKLNEKINDLTSLDKMIAEIKEDSEQMELIALNAMVISVKSGEKGLAFSRITENLQRLSKDMFVYSDKLSEEEKHLLEQINQLKSIFSGIINSQKSIASKDTECAEVIRRMSMNVNPQISELSREVDSIYPTIEKTMAVINDKAKVQSDFNAASKSLTELDKYNAPAASSEEELDYICFSIKIYEKAYELLSRISSAFSMSCSTFAGNWAQVLEILEKADNLRMDFESRFLNNHAFGNDNIQKQVSSALEKYQHIISEFNNYHIVQKDLQATCQNITGRAKTIYSVFESLRPVMSRLHHVRILQQIEVSKNDAIKSVQDSVTDMDNLINSANKSLDAMEAILENFIKDTGTMLKNFTVSIENDNEEMFRIRNEKEVTLGDLENTKVLAEKATQDFAVFPDDFQKKCVIVQQNLQEFMRLNSELGSFQNEIDVEKNSLLSRRTALFNERGLQNWEIKNSKYLDSLAQI